MSNNCKKNWEKVRTYKMTHNCSCSEARKALGSPKKDRRRRPGPSYYWTDAPCKNCGHWIRKEDLDRFGLCPNCSPDRDEDEPGFDRADPPLWRQDRKDLETGSD